MKFKKILVLFLSLVLMTQTFLPVYALGNETYNLKKNREITITDKEFLEATEKAYKNGKITKDDYISIKSSFNSRWGIRGETKIIDLGNGKFDIYINSLIADTIVGISAAAVACVLSEVAVVAKFLSGLGSIGEFAKVLSAAIATSLTKADNGLIIHCKKVPFSAPIIIGIDEQ